MLHTQIGFPTDIWNFEPDFSFSERCKNFCTAINFLAKSANFRAPLLQIGLDQEIPHLGTFYRTKLWSFGILMKVEVFQLMFFFSVTNERNANPWSHSHALTVWQKCCSDIFTHDVFNASPHPNLTYPSMTKFCCIYTGCPMKNGTYFLGDIFE